MPESDGDAFASAATAEVFYNQLRVDVLLETMNDSDADKIRAVLLNRQISAGRCAAGFHNIGLKVSDSAIRNWRLVHVDDRR